MPGQDAVYLIFTDYQGTEIRWAVANIVARIALADTLSFADHNTSPDADA